MYHKKLNIVNLLLTMFSMAVIIFISENYILGSGTAKESVISNTNQSNEDNLNNKDKLFDDEIIKEFYSLFSEGNPYKIHLKQRIKKNREGFSEKEALKFLNNFNDPNISSPDSHLCSNYLIKFVYLFHDKQERLSEVYDILSIKSRHKLFVLLGHPHAILDVVNDSYFDIASKYIIDWCNNYDAWISEVKPSFVGIYIGNSVEVLLHTSEERFVPLIDSILNMNDLPGIMRKAIISEICRKNIISEKLVIHVKDYYKQQGIHQMALDVLIMKYLVENIGNREAYSFFNKCKIHHEKKQNAASNVINYMKNNGLIYLKEN